MIFVLVAISAMGCIVINLLTEMRAKKFFYSHIVKSYGFLDGNKLLGALDIEEESMRNLVSAAIFALRKNGGSDGMMFMSENGDLKSDVLADYDFGSMLSELSLKAKNVRHNNRLDVEVGIFPMDDKIPFTEKFGPEIVKVVELVFKEEGISDLSAMKITEPMKIFLDKTAYTTGRVNTMQPEDRAAFLIAGMIGVEAFTGAKSWDSIFNGDTAKERRVLKTLGESLAFSTDVEAVNFFVANKYVRKAICEEFCKKFRHEVELLAKNANVELDALMASQVNPPATGVKAATSPRIQGEFAFDRNWNLLLAHDVSDDDITRAKKDLNAKLLQLMCEKIAADKDTNPNDVSFGNDKPYQVRTGGKIFMLHDGVDAFMSYSKAIEIVVHMWDKDLKTVINKISRRPIKVTD
jgi:hypothetical protein